MTTHLDALLQAEPHEWINTLPEYQRKSIDTLLSGGASLDDIAQAWLTASAENTSGFASQPVVKKETFLENLKKEISAFLCDNKYKKDREKLYGEKSVTPQFVTSTIAVAIAPHLGVAIAVISPVITIVIASLGKITLSAFCATYKSDDA